MFGVSETRLLAALQRQMGCILLIAEFYGWEELHDNLTLGDWKMARTIMDNQLNIRVRQK